MTNEQKQEIVNHLLQAQGDSTIVTTIRMFIDKINEKSNRDINILLSNIKDMIRDNERIMLDILGEGGLNYFKNYQLPTDFAPTESEGIE